MAGAETVKSDKESTLKQPTTRPNNIIPAGTVGAEVDRFELRPVSVTRSIYPQTSSAIAAEYQKYSALIEGLKPGGQYQSPSGRTWIKTDDDQVMYNKNPVSTGSSPANPNNTPNTTTWGNIEQRHLYLREDGGTFITVGRASVGMSQHLVFAGKDAVYDLEGKKLTPNEKGIYNIAGKPGVPESAEHKCPPFVLAGPELVREARLENGKVMFRTHPMRNDWHEYKPAGAAPSSKPETAAAAMTAPELTAEEKQRAQAAFKAEALRNALQNPDVVRALEQGSPTNKVSVTLHSTTIQYDPAFKHPEPLKILPNSAHFNSINAALGAGYQIVVKPDRLPRIVFEISHGTNVLERLGVRAGKEGSEEQLGRLATALNQLRSANPQFEKSPTSDGGASAGKK